ncbi:hypothetical protein WHI96_25960 [Pseudonocardia tropica]|uniref:Uncharacterized protein n=1 Tax=Pseudonocardia tropica TaxID=681289 RepID=A0ABV1K3X4_9PSEU
MPPELGRSDEAVRAHVDGKKRAWLAGLAKGLVLAGRGPIAEQDVYFPFYGNLLADMIAAHEAAGGNSPDLESAPVQPAAFRAAQDMTLDAAAELGFSARRRMARTDPGALDELLAGEEAVADGREAGISDLLKGKIVREALQFLADKTGTPEWIIERFLRDVAYYLEDDAMRQAVLDKARHEIERAVGDGHQDLVIVGHSLGSVVAYDLCAEFVADIQLRLLVTVGSPLGYQVVRRNLFGAPEGTPDRPVPPAISPHPGTPGRETTWWLNAFDVLDVVALVHPLAPRFTQGDERIRDERTFNPSDPHSIGDYLSDPDVAGPIGDAVAGGH